MSAVNKVILIGRLGKDPETITFDSGTKKASFSLATSETWKDKSGEKQEKTEWHNIICFKSLAEIVEKYLHKGDQVYIEGKLTYRSYEQDGVKKYITEIIAGNLTMLGSKQQSDHVDRIQQSTVAQPEQTASAPIEADDLPF